MAHTEELKRIYTTDTASDMLSGYDQLLEAHFDGTTHPIELSEWTALDSAVEQARHDAHLLLLHTPDSQRAQSRYKTTLGDIWQPCMGKSREVRRRLRESTTVGEDGGATSDVDPGLLVEQALLEAQYLEIVASQRIAWQGEAVSPAALRPFLWHEHRNLRNRAWTGLAECRNPDIARLSEVWGGLVDVRARIRTEKAKMHWPRGAVDITRMSDRGPSSEAMRLAVEEWVSPVLVRLHEERRLTLRSRALRVRDLLISQAASEPSGMSSAATTLRDIAQVLGPVFPEIPAFVDTLAAAGRIHAEANGGKLAWPHVGRGPLDRLPALVHALPSDGASDADLAGLLCCALGAAQVDGVNAHPFARSVDRWTHYFTGMLWVDAQRSPRGNLVLERYLLDWAIDAIGDAFVAWACTNSATAGPSACEAMWRRLWLQYLPSVDLGDDEHAAAVSWHYGYDLFLDPHAYALRLHARVQAAHHFRSLQRNMGLAGDVGSVDQHDVREAVAIIEDEMESRLAAEV